MFQVKATIVGVLGDEDAYPCHFKHKIGDEVVFDGERYHGRLCPALWPLIVPKVAALHQAGPRYVEWGSYYPFWYCPASAADPAAEKQDGLGFKNVLRTLVPPSHDMARLSPDGAFEWPPSPDRTIARDPVVICPDSRTSVVVRLEAFDLSEKGFDTSYFRRQMAILAKLLKSGGLASDKILESFSPEEIEDIYPALGPVAVEMLTEELELMGYVKTVDGTTAVTPKGEAKLEVFKAGLPPDHLEAFARYAG